MNTELMLNLSVSDFELVCRLCLAREDLKPFEKHVEDILRKIADIEVSILLYYLMFFYNFLMMN